MLATIDGFSGGAKPGALDGQKVLVAMSGGVDSAIAAAELISQGARCESVTLKMCDDEKTEADIASAAGVSAMLGIEHHVLDASREFGELVVTPFCQSYLSGLTPNPCIDCNRNVKIPLVLELALGMGFDMISTGHYARVSRNRATGRPSLLKGRDPTKDQSYVLCHLSQDQLSRLVLPLGEFTKQEVRARAASMGLPCAGRPESQDICFVPDGDHAGFIERFSGRPLERGDIIDLDGKVVGEHGGIARYTVGQRKGLGIALGYTAYVCSKDAARNAIVVGPKDKLLATEMLVGDWNWVSMKMEAPFRALVKSSYRQNPVEADVEPLGGGAARVAFLEPVESSAPGQTAVAYIGDVVVGGGTIMESAGMNRSEFS